MDYETMLELLYSTRDMLEDIVETPDDPEIHAEYINKLKTTNQVIDLVRNTRDGK